MKEIKPYLVKVRVEAERTYLVDARTPEEAEDVVLADIDQLEPVEVEETFEVVDCYPENGND